MAVSNIPGDLTQARRRYLRAPAPVLFPDEELVPETGFHLRVRTALFLVLDRALRGKAFVGSDQFLYWDATNPKACLAPDILVRIGGPFELLRSYKIWQHGAPHLAVEIVSSSDDRDRDWPGNLGRYRHTGIAEIVRFDAEDPSNPLRLWDNVGGDLVERDVADPEAFRCDALGAYWTVVAHPELGLTLRVARDREGKALWPTLEEAEMAASAAADTERTAKEAALARIAELERELAERR
jgi:Uma2 family endonuclease